ncbi:MAG: response regulator, partial [Candidatus Brocadiae bacterium]|nr:response regulator [Candidatus Brocadiia bacterium]
MTASGNSDSEPKTILVVTDTPEDLHALQEQLGDEGYQLNQTWDTEKALEQVEDDAPDLVLLDITSPEIRGLEFCEKLRSRAGTEAIPVIVIAEQRSAEQEEA